MQWLLSVLLLSQCAIFCFGSTSFTCYLNNVTNTFYVREGIDNRGIAWAQFFEELNETGWNRLTVESNGDFDDPLQMGCSGFVEGYITQQQIYTWWRGFHVNLFKNQPMPFALQKFLFLQFEWMRDMAKKNAATDPYWEQVQLVIDQLNGLTAGYNSAALENGHEDQSLEFLSILALNAHGDIQTLLNKFPIEESENEVEKWPFKPQHLDCSALIKVLSDKSDIYAGHTTWTAYYSMHRIFKNYHLPLKTKSTVSKRVAFSSRPAYLSSKDDFYMLDSGMVSQETTNEFRNKSLYDAIVPQSILTWTRVIVANRMANSGREWTKTFARYNSGTYNNQWMVLDFKKFTPGHSIGPNTLWILEQIPGYTESADVSSFLEQHGYWPSYNVPYFSFIYNISGFPNGSAENGQSFMYTEAPRAKIFARNQTGVESLDAMKAIMQFNDWQVDPLSEENPAFAISSRYDLSKEKPEAFGGIDSKIATGQNLATMEAVAISGPTHQQQTPFQWSNEWKDVDWSGLPKLWNFDYITIRPSI